MSNVNNYIYLRGRVRFPTGGEPDGKSASGANSVDSVRFRDRQYSLDGRRISFTVIVMPRCVPRFFICAGLGLSPCIKMIRKVRPRVSNVPASQKRSVTMEKKSKPISARKLAMAGMLSAAAFVLMYLEIPIPIMPSFIKFDFSDLPALIGAFALGPIWGVIIELIKNLLHLVVSQSMFIGELSNFILGATFTLAAGLVYMKKKTKKNAFIAGLIGALVMAIVSIPSNYFLVYPVYIKAYFDGSLETCLAMYNAICWEVADTGVGPHLFEVKSLMQALLIFNVPFTFLKGLISVVISMLIYKPLSKFIKGSNDKK